MSEHSELKKEFQIERMILFTDAVFAIAITLLIIEIKAPKIIDGMNSKAMTYQLMELIPKFVGFIISFFVIAIYWRSHHRLFSFVKDYDDKLIWLNFFFLFSIILMPFSSAYYSDNTPFSLPFCFYCLNVALTGLLNYAMLNYVIKHRGRISDSFEDINAQKLARWRTLVVPAIFFLGAILDLILPSENGLNMISRLTPMLVWPVINLLNKHFGKVNDLEFNPKPTVKKRTKK